MEETAGEQHTNLDLLQRGHDVVKMGPAATRAAYNNFF